MACFYYVLMTLTHELFINKVTSLPYYSTAAIFDLVSMILMASIKPTPNIAVKLSFICVISICLNFYGWLIYILYIKPVTYDIGFIILYAVAIYVFLSKDKISVADNPLINGRFSIHSCFNEISSHIRRKKTRK